MKKAVWIVLVVFMTAATAFAAYHHEGEADSDKFLSVYPDKAGTKLDHCATCHSAGSYERNGKMVELGSCQWCHYSYGYDASGNILDTMNPYGKDYHYNGRNADAVKAIENIDSDGDGYSNLAEIKAVRYPGNDSDDPSKVVAPYRIYTKTQLNAMDLHTQFMLMNTSRSGDFYAEYAGVPMQDLLEHAGISDSATGITVFAPDGWATYHPLEIDPDPELYHVNGVYPEAVYNYDEQADTAINVVDGWCDYSAPSCAGRNNGDTIAVEGGLKMLLATKREGLDMDAGILSEDNKLDGEGPFRVVPPQKTPSPPDQASNADNQDVVWPYDSEWDHNAGAASRTATIIRVEPLPEGTTDIDIFEDGWKLVDEEKVIVYGALDTTAWSGFQYYLPTFRDDDAHAVGLGLRNTSVEQAAQVSVIVYSRTGEIMATDNYSLPARGQKAAVLGRNAGEQGWIHVVSDVALTGVCFLSTLDTMNFMADMPIYSQLNTALQVPHVAQNEFWDTVVYVANPNSAQTAVTLRFVGSDGTVLYTKAYQIPAMGAGEYALGDLVENTTQDSGSVEIESTNGVVAFALYHDLKTGSYNYAGVAAMAP